MFKAAATVLRPGFCLKTDYNIFGRLISCITSTLFAGAVVVVRWDIIEVDRGGGRLGKRLDGNKTNLETGGGSIIPKDRGNGLAARRFTGLTEDTWSSRISQRLYIPSGS